MSFHPDYTRCTILKPNQVLCLILPPLLERTMRVYLWKHFPSKELFYLDIGHGFVYFFSRVGFWCLFANWWVSLQRSDNKSSSFVLSILKNRTIPSSLGGFEHANDERAWSYFPLFGVLSLIDVVCFVLQ